MAEITASEIRDYLLNIQGREIDLDKLRREFRITQESKSWDGIRTIMFRLADGKHRLVKPSGRRDGVYKVIKQVKPVSVFGVERERRPPFPLVFPRDFDTGMEFPFSEDIVIREGDIVLIAGQSNYGKTTIAMQFCAENIDRNPVLMGNEYTKDDEPLPRFLNRLDAMDWVEWTNGDGGDKFLLLPVDADYPEHIVEDRINIADWVKLDPNRLYEISDTMDAMKKAVGKGIVIAVIQKSETSDSGRGGQFTKDFADVELLIDRHTDNESRITIGKVKESTRHVIGRSWAYEISKGVKLHNIREVVKCFTCHGFKYIKGKGACDTCCAVGWIDR